MTPEPSWDDLLPRLHADLSEENESAGQHDDPVWSAARRKLTWQARALFQRQHSLQWQEIDDIVQDTLVKLRSPQTLRRLKLAGSSQGYILAMLRNAHIDLVRRRRREVQLAPAAEEFISGEWQEATDRGVAARDQVSRLISYLSPEDRRLLELRFWEGRSIAEIATVLSISYSATAVRLFRLLRYLRSL